MRINVYSQELSREVALVSKRADTGIVHYGVRIFFEGSPRLHHRPDDDDRSAITYWLPSSGSFSAADLAGVFSEAARLAASLPDAEGRRDEG
jgi:hypothetical protein